MQSMLMHVWSSPWLLVFSIRLLIAVTAIWLCAGVANIALRSFSAALKHRVWAMSTAAVLLTPILLLVMPEWRTGIIRTERIEPVLAAAAPSRVVAPSDSQQEIVQSEPSERAIRGARGPIESEPMTIPPVSEKPATVLVQPAHRTPGLIALKFAVRPWLIFVMWLVPAMLLIMRMLLARLAVSRMVRASSSPNARWQAMLAELCEKSRARQPRLCVSEQTLTPLCLGIVRPTILIPASASDWDDARIQSVLMHELSHVLRRDVLWHTLAQLACSIYWFHPLSWIVQWQMRIEREIACDDSVVSASQPATYARSLLDLASTLRSARAIHGVTTAGVAMANSANLEHRVKAILDADRRRSPVSGRLGIAIGVVAITALALFSTLSPFAAYRAKAAEAPKSDRPPKHAAADGIAGTEASAVAMPPTEWTTIQLKPGKAPGTFHLVRHARATLTIEGKCDLIVSITDALHSVQSTAPVNASRDFTVEADLHPGTYWVSVAPKDASSTDYWPSRSSLRIHIDQAGHLYLLESERSDHWTFVIVKRINGFSPGQMAIADNLQPALSWPAVPGALFYTGALFYEGSELDAGRAESVHVSQPKLLASHDLPPDQKCIWSIVASDRKGEILAEGRGTFFGKGTKAVVIEQALADQRRGTTALSAGASYLGIRSAATWADKSPTKTPPVGTFSIPPGSDTDFIPAIRIVEVLPRSPAINAGLLPDDVIVALNDHPVPLDPKKGIADVQAFTRQILVLAPGSRVRLKVRRFPTELTVTAAIGRFSGLKAETSATRSTSP